MGAEPAASAAAQPDSLVGHLQALVEVGFRLATGLVEALRSPGGGLGGCWDLGGPFSFTYISPTVCPSCCTLLDVDG